MKKFGLFWAFSLLLATAGHAQSSDPFAELERQMEKMMQELRSGYSLHFPPGATDTTFYFKLDTTINGRDGGFFFNFTPPDGQAMEEAFGFEEFMKEFNDFFDRGYDERHRREKSPSDDGELRNGGDNDEPLPEERLRQREEGMQPRSGAPAKPNAQKPKIKTSRI